MSNPLPVATGLISGALLAATLTALTAVIPAALRPATPPAMVKIGAAMLLGGCDSTHRCCKPHCDRLGEVAR